MAIVASSCSTTYKFLCFFFILGLIALPSFAANCYVYWNTLDQPSAWTKEVTCNTDDALVFVYSEGIRAVYQVSPFLFDICAIVTIGEKGTWIGRGGSATTVTGLPKGTSYFIPANPVECDFGMKVQVTIN
ncbi:hypothetical protein ACH5RR_033064 [Cinchona calisaya]|uniref:Phytocyanin domain-containing protein n=1 Tax=Cinchona calisaya TaxID=153742 RepID=A0ABD2YN16_9GENT